MSKLTDLLNRGKVPRPTMGFHRVAGSAPKPKILLIVILKQNGSSLKEGATDADAAVVSLDSPDSLTAVQGKEAPVPWGAWLKTHPVEPDALVKAGADFVIFPPEMEVVASESLAKVLEVKPSLDEGLLAAANRLAVDAVLLTDIGTGSLTWASLMVIQRSADILTKPLLVALPFTAGQAQLKALWDAGMDGIVVEQGITELRKLIDSTEFPLPRRRAKHEAVLPALAASAEAPPEEEEEEEP